MSVTDAQDMMDIAEGVHGSQGNDPDASPASTSQGMNHSGDVSADGMEVDAPASGVIQSFRRSSVILGRYPWSNGAVMQPNLSDIFDKSHYAYRFSLALQKYDSKVATTSATLAYVRSALRDVACDRYASNTSAQIVRSEMRDLKSVDHASEVCSMVTALRVLDVLYDVERPGGNLCAPEHRRLPMDFSDFPVTKLVADWPSIAQKFQKNFNNRNLRNTSALAFNTFSSRQINALYQLNDVLQANKRFLNLQLAATHLAFMLDHASGETVPDFPTTLKALDTSNIRSPSESAAFTSQFETLLQSLGEDVRLDYLRLPLQVAAILSPIFLLQDTVIHKSKAYCQRYKLMLYAKCLGNERPKSVIRLETVIWKALFNMACGEIDVYAAAESIAGALSPILDNLEDGDKSWFHLDDTSKRDKFHLSSFDIVQSSVPENWPMASTVFPPPPTLPSQTPPANGATEPTIPPPDDDAMDVSGAPDPEPSSAPPNNNDPAPSSARLSPPPVKRTRRAPKRDYKELGGQRSQAAPRKPRKVTNRASRRTAAPSSTVSDETRETPRPGAVPVIVGTRYIKIDVIDLSEIEKEKTPTFKAEPRSGKGKKTHPFKLISFGAFEQSEPHELRFSDREEHDAFAELESRVAEGFFHKKPRHFTKEGHSYVEIMPKHMFDASPIPVIHAHLRVRTIVIPDQKLGYVPFNRQGLRTLDSLDAIVQIEDQSLQAIESGTLRQFIEHVESRGANKVLRMARMPSETSPSQTRFGSEFVSWRETKSRVYCQEEDPSLIKRLAWNDIATANSTHWWTLTPSAFGEYFDVRDGSQWVVIATPFQERTNPEVQIAHYFGLPGHFVSTSERMKIGSEDLSIDLEAILMTEGMRIILPPNSLYAVFTTENCITTGGYFLSVPNMANSLYGVIHSFILGEMLNDGDIPSAALYLRRIIHYLHTRLIVKDNIGIDDDDDYHHNLTFEDVEDDKGTVIKKAVNDVESLFALVSLAIFMNALDKRTYMPFPQSGELAPEERQRQVHMDLNAIPHLERRHCCYARGLAWDLIAWFFNNYELRGGDRNPKDGYMHQIAPTITQLARNMVRYKKKAAENGIVGFCSASAFQRQVEMAIFGVPVLRLEYQELVREEKSKDINTNDLHLPFSLNACNVVKLAKSTERYPFHEDYFSEGKNMADAKYFAGMKGLSNQDAIDVDTHISSDDEEESGMSSGEQSNVSAEEEPNGSSEEEGDSSPDDKPLSTRLGKRRRQ